MSINEKPIRRWGNHVQMWKHPHQGTTASSRAANVHEKIVTAVHKLGIDSKEQRMRQGDKAGHEPRRRDCGNESNRDLKVPIARSS